MDSQGINGGGGEGGIGGGNLGCEDNGSGITRKSMSTLQLYLAT